MKISNRSKFLFFFLLASVLGGSVFLYYQQRTIMRTHINEEVPSTPYPKHGVEIQGFHFEGHYKGKRIITINAEKFTIQKMKLGFFRFGMLNVANFKNADIDIYGESIKVPVSLIPNTSHRTTDGSNPRTQLSRGITFSDVFRKESLPLFSKKRISSILIEPVCFRLHDENSLIMMITATSATIRLKNRDFLFNGDVQVTAGLNVLQTDQLILIPENGILKTDHHFLLRTPKKRVKGDCLRTDIFLQK